jgi:hypothetical protein
VKQSETTKFLSRDEDRSIFLNEERWVLYGLLLKADIEFKDLDGKSTEELRQQWEEVKNAA